ncbi:MAG: AmpG family muropeptide MFS transporter [Alphaproteobacteria bacterium]
MSDQTSPIVQRKSVLQALRVYFEAPVFTMILFGFASGLPLALTGSTLLGWMTEEGVSLTSIGLFASVGVPYSLKFLWSPLIDGVPLPVMTRLFGRRRGWLITLQILLIGAIVLLGMNDPTSSLFVTAVLALAVSTLSASQDIVIDAFRIESLDEDRMAAGASAYVFGYRAGMLLSGAGAFALAEFYSWPMAYFVMAAALGVMIFVTLWRPEPAEVPPEDAEGDAAAGPAGSIGHFIKHSVIGPFADFMTRRQWWLILLFIMFYKFGDSLAGVMTTPFLLTIGFEKLEIVGIVKTFGFAATMAGFALGGPLAAGMGLVRALWIAGVLQMLSNLMFAVQAVAGADPTILTATIAIENLAGGLGTAVFVAYMSSLCHISYTATQYALLSSFMAFARTLLSSGAGAMADWLDWTGFFLMTTVAALPGFVFLWVITRKQDASVDSNSRA